MSFSSPLESSCWAVQTYTGGALQVDVASPPRTSIEPKRGVVSSGNITLAFHLVGDQADDHAAQRQPVTDQTGAAHNPQLHRLLWHRHIVNIRLPQSHLLELSISAVWPNLTWPAAGRWSTLQWSLNLPACGTSAEIGQVPFVQAQGMG